MDVRTIATINLLVQVALMLAFGYGAYISLRVRNQRRHCRVFKIAVPVQIASILAVMLPALLGYIQFEVKPPWFKAELLIHHSAGLAVVLLWIYAIIAFTWVPTLRQRRRLLWPMRAAFWLWIFTFASGVHQYLLVYL